MRQNTVDFFPLCKNCLVYLVVGPPKRILKMIYVWKIKTDRVHRRTKRKKTINLLNINSNISDGFFFHIYSLGISKRGYNWGHVYTRYIYI